MFSFFAQRDFFAAKKGEGGGAHGKDITATIDLGKQRVCTKKSKNHTGSNAKSAPGSQQAKEGSRKTTTAKARPPEETAVLPEPESSTVGVPGGLELGCCLS